MDCSGRIAILPGSVPINIVLPPDAKAIHLLQSASGHLLLPLDDSFTAKSTKKYGKALILTTSQAIYTTEASPDEEAPPVPSKADKPISESSVLIASRVCDESVE